MIARPVENQFPLTRRLQLRAGVRYLVGLVLITIHLEFAAVAALLWFWFAAVCSEYGETSFVFFRAFRGS